MSAIRILYRDYDRAPYLYTLQACAKQRGLDVALTKAELGGRFPEFLLEGATDFLAGVDRARKLRGQVFGTRRAL